MSDLLEFYVVFMLKCHYAGLIFIVKFLPIYNINTFLIINFVATIGRPTLWLVGYER